MPKDIEEAVKILTNQAINKELRFYEYDSIYPFCNENIEGYMPNLTDKSVLTVAGSGDHYFQAIYNGATEVDCFDINKLTYYYLKLKKTAIETLDIEEFNYYFDTMNDEIFNYDMYLKIRPNLDIETCYFFDTLYQVAFNKGEILYNSKLFFDGSARKIDIYKSEEKYETLRKKLSLQKDINFIHTDIAHVRFFVSSNYDAIFLSNIGEYQRPYDYLKIVEDMKKLLNLYGQIYFAYLYDYDKKCRYNSEYIEVLNNDKNCTSINLDSLYENESKEKVIIYNKIL